MKKDGNICVLFVTHTAVVAGANLSMLQLMIELKDYHNIVPLVLMPPIRRGLDFKDECDKHGIRSYVAKFHWFKEKTCFLPLLRYLSNIIWYTIIFYKLRNEKIDIVHSNGSVIDIGVVLSKIKRVPHVWHLREFGELDFGVKSVLGRNYEKFVYSGGDVFVAISKIIRNHYSTIIPKQKIQLVYNGITPPPDSMLSKHNNPEIRFCIVGIVSPNKNQKEALEAMNILVNKMGVNNVSLTFVGKEDPVYVQELKKYSEHNNLHGHICFLGERNDVGNILSTMDVGLMTSKSEAFGRVTVEYMMHDLAVIASSTGANPEIIAHETTGLLYKLGDTMELACQMKKVIDDKKLLMKLAENGRLFSLNSFPSRRNSDQIYHIYESLLN